MDKKHPMTLFVLPVTRKAMFGGLFSVFTVCCLIIFPAIAAAHEDDGSFPPCELIAGNIHSTDMTVAVEITGVEKERSIKPDDGVGGYIVFRVAARVFMAYKGEIKKGDKIIYGVLIEAGINPPETGTKQIVSLRKKGKKLIVPDVGYVFEYSGKLNRLYVKAAGSGKAL